METIMRKVLHKYCLSVCIALLVFHSQIAFAVNYTVTGSSPGTIAPAGPNPPGGGATPPLLLNIGDNVTVNDGATMSAPSTNGLNFIIGVSNATTPASTTAGATTSITIGNSTPSTASVTYAGTSTSGAAISFIRSDTNTNTMTITNNGTLSAGTGLYSVYLNNATGGTPADTYNITLNSGSLASGAILSTGIHKVNVTLNGTANITGTVNLNVNGGIVAATAANSAFIIQGGANFTPASGLSNIGILDITGSSTLTINQFNSNIYSINIDPNSTLNINQVLNGISSSDGALSNNGTMNITANIAKTGTFTGTGTVTVSEAVNFATNGYTMTTHNMVLTDVSDLGTVTMSTLGKSMTVTNFNVNYSNGYFPGGNITLATTSGGGATVNYTLFSKPSNTLFLTFGTQTASGNATILLPVTRTPFNALATTSLTQTIGVTLESLGGSNPNAAMLAVLNGVEASTTQAALEYSLMQLAPLISAPIFCYEVQTESLKQVELRLAALREGQTSYLAGDIGKDNYAWIRPFGSFANQLAKDDTFGYYGTSGGVAFGFDRNLDTTYTLGAAIIYAQSHVTDKVNQISNTKIKSYIAMGYGTYNFSEVSYFDWILGVTANNFNATRVINLNGVYQQTALSSYGSQQVAAQGIWGKCYSMFDFLQATPEASVLYTFAKQYTYTETGGNGANLIITRPNSDILQLGLGTKLSTPLYINPGIVVPEIHATAFYYPITGKQNSIFSFVQGGGPMVSIFNMSRTGLEIGCALTVAVIDRLQLKFEFDYDIQDRYSAHSMYLDIRYML